ncbi:hypothetical protein MESS4_330048 [Mesorhizobium sp. STM 4661]|nr:hypothetical protein MESS4_330048 [Mesorhizobium sp. STM 4661]
MFRKARLLALIILVVPGTEQLDLLLCHPRSVMFNHLTESFLSDKVAKSALRLLRTLKMTNPFGRVTQPRSGSHPANILERETQQQFPP